MDVQIYHNVNDFIIILPSNKYFMINELHFCYIFFSIRNTVFAKWFDDSQGNLHSRPLNSTNL